MKRIYTIMFAASMVLVAVAIVALGMWGLQLGVDFHGGSVLEVSFAARPAIADVTNTLTALKLDALKEVTVNPAGAADVVIKSATLSETEHAQVLAALNRAFKDQKPTQVRFDAIGPAIGSELKSNSLWAIGVALLAISLYIAVMFRAMRRQLSWWVMSIATLFALAHDILLPLGLFAILGHFTDVEISAVFVAAILTIMGYSISDTVVVFDRVRENILKGGLNKDTTFGQVVHQSIMQTLVRSINTNITTLLSLVAIYFFGGDSIRYFALALIVGIMAGAYSSIFVASPILVWFSRSRRA